jgi:hypothetical protein
MRMAASCLRFAAALAIAVALAGCGRTESYRYKLTLAVNTPEGIKRGSAVVEAIFWRVSIPDRGIMHKLRGESLYLDLGAGARPLVALLTKRLKPCREGQEWSPDGGLGIRYMSGLYAIAPSADIMDTIATIARVRGPHPITPKELPDLVTFADIDEPKTVVEVNTNDLQATLGSGISWNEITLESTDEPVSKGIEWKLPWIPAYFEKNLRLDGSDHGAKDELTNILSWWDFDQSDDLIRAN